MKRPRPGPEPSTIYHLPPSVRIRIGHLVFLVGIHVGHRLRGVGVLLFLLVLDIARRPLAPRILKVFGRGKPSVRVGYIIA